jgi:hypothetical protein
MAVTTIQEWRGVLRDVDNQGDVSSRKRIYEVFVDGGYQYKALSDTEILTDPIYSSWSCPVRRLSLKEIVDISFAFIDGEIVRREISGTNPSTVLRQFIHKNSEQVSAQQINNEMSEAEPIVEIASIVDKFYRHAKEKHTSERIQGIWGRIKSYIWFKFFDCKTQVQNVLKGAEDAGIALKQTVFSTCKAQSLSWLKKHNKRQSDRFSKLAECYRVKTF